MLLSSSDSGRHDPAAPDPGPDGDPRRGRWRWRLGLLIPLAVLVTLVFGVGGWQSEALKPRTAAKDPPPLVPRASEVTLLPTKLAPAPVDVAQGAANAAVELAGSGDHSLVRWLPDWGLWGNHDAAPGARVNWGSPYWWQSAIELRALIRYLELTHNSQPIYQQVIVGTFERNVRRPGTPVPVNFGNKWMDDTAWWGLAWLEAARYELNIRDDQALAARFLKVAEWTANYVWTQPRACHQAGIEWQRGFPPDTITNAEFVALAGELAYFLEQPGPFQNTAAARIWTSRGSQILWWLRRVNLANIRSGHVYDGYDAGCKIAGGALVYTLGEMADGLVQMGLATGRSVDFWEAKQFIKYAFRPKSRMLSGGVLQQPCEAEARRCINLPSVHDSTVYKGLFVDAVSDWEVATGSTDYDGFLRRQSQAVIDAASNGSRLTQCQTPHECQFTFYWARPEAPAVSHLAVAPGSQESGLSVLTDELTATSGFTG